MSSFSIFDQTQVWAKEIQLKCVAEEIINSTNDKAKNIAFQEHQEFIVIANEQTAGRGRGTHNWKSPAKGSALLATWSLPLQKSPQNLTSPIIGLALISSLQALWPSLNWSLKAPNDVFLDNKKVAGLLIDSLNQGQLFRLNIGLGINVFSSPTDVDNAGHIVSSIGLSQLSPEKWNLFLNQLHKSWQNAHDEIISSSLKVATREALLKALNANPWLDETLVDVSENGDLVFENSIKKWQEI